MRLPGYHEVTSGASAVRKFRIAVLCASRSLMLVMTLMSGFSALNFSMAVVKRGFLGSGVQVVEVDDQVGGPEQPDAT